MGDDADAPKEQRQLPIYQQEEPVEGSVLIKIKPDRTLEHQGVKIELIGLAKYPESEEWKQFYMVSEELPAPAVLDRALTKLPFIFKGVPNAECIYASFESSELRIKYVLRVTVGRIVADIKQERMLWIASLPGSAVDSSPTGVSKNVEIGVENYIRVDFFLEDLYCTTTGQFRGFILFHTLNLPVCTAQVCLVQKIVRLDTMAQVGQRVLKAQQILDGQPVLHTRVPFRMGLLDCAVLGEFAGGGTVPEVGKLWGVRYFLQLVLVDTQERHYYKQQEVSLRLLPSDVITVKAQEGMWELFRTAIAT